MPRPLGLGFLLIVLACLAGHAAPWSQAFPPADLRAVVAGGGQATLTTYRNEDVLQADLSRQKGAAEFGVADLFDFIPGRYRVTFRLSIAPPPVGRAQDIRLKVVQAGHQKDDGLLVNLPFDWARFAADGSPADYTADFTVLTGNRAGGAKPLRLFLAWTTRGDLSLLRHHGITIERISDTLGITGLQAEKLIYRPGEPGVVRATVRNFTAQEQRGTLQLALLSELADRTSLPDVPVTVPAGQQATVALPFTAAGRWGVCAQALLTCDETRDTAVDYFSVSEDHFEVGIGSVWGSAAHTGLGQHRTIPGDARAIYSNLVELFFWAPCDWAKLVSPLKRWWSGQTSYPEDEDNLKELITLCHAKGIKVSAYVNCNPAGPFGWEAARAHPEWFHRTAQGSINGNYDVEILDHYNDQEWRKVKGDYGQWGWFILRPDLRRLDALDHGIDEIIASAKHYGWDSVRFDGHYTIIGNDELSTRNMRRLKERVWKELPGFRFGFNYGYSPEAHGGVNHEIREAMAGGGQYMQEAIRAFRFSHVQYTSWRHFAENELKVAKAINATGGSYHCIWPIGEEPYRDIYTFTYGLIGGGHPVYAGFQKIPGCLNWGAFMTRWSGMLWDHGLRVIEKPETRLRVDGEQIEWRPFVQERIESAKRKFVVLHLTSPPPSDKIWQTPPPLETNAPTQPADVDPDDPDGVLEDLEIDAAPTPTAPKRAPTVTITYRPEPGTTVTRATLIRPEATPYDTTVPMERAGDELRLRVPRPFYWQMVVLEVAGQFTPPAIPGKLTEPPDPAQFAKGGGDGLAVQDPLKAPTKVTTSTDARVIMCSHGSQNIGCSLIPDPDSEPGQVEWRDKTQQHGSLGMSWVGPIAPGKYRVTMRVKWTDPTGDSIPQQLSMSLLDGDWKTPLLKMSFATPGNPQLREGVTALGNSGQYQEYLLGTFEKKITGFVHFMGGTSTTKVSEHSLYLERFTIETLERYPDAKIAEWTTVEKPAGLRIPDGAKPKKVLLVKGMFWQQYAVEKAVLCDTAYQLPKGYEALYAYDALILCNVDFTYVSYETRKQIADFVRDGGRLVIFGGSFTLGQGSFRHTYLEELMPFVLKGPHEVVACDPPLLLGAKAGTPFAEKPALYWRHDVMAQPNVEILAYAGDHPVAARWQVGKGRVAAFAGTVLGEGATPFWMTPSWNALAGRLMLE